MGGLYSAWSYTASHPNAGIRLSVLGARFPHEPNDKEANHPKAH